MNWKTDQKIILDAYFDVINKSNAELDRILLLNQNEAREIYPLVEFVINRIDAVFSLTTNWMVWDAEIVLRSALETFVKLLFITSSSGSERINLLNEYWFSLSEIYILKQSEQAKKNLKHTLGKETHYLAYAPQVISEEKEKELREKWPKSERTKLEQKWSFGGIVNFLARNYSGTKNKFDKPLEIIELLTHSYRMASHVTHGDETGILIIKERDSRPANEKDAVYIAHYLRLVSDCCYYCLWSAISTMDYLNLEKKYFFDLQTPLNDLNNIIAQYHSAVFEDKLYDKFRNKN